MSTKDVFDWTEAGRTALLAEASHGPRSLREVSDAELRAKVAGVVSRYLPAWERGLAKGDDVGHAAVTLLSGDWESALAIETDPQLAGVASLLGAWSSADTTAFVELALRGRGIASALAMLVAMWSLKTSYDNPDWPESEARLAIWLKAIEPDSPSSSAQDASVSYAKGDAARYLAARYRDSDAETQRAAASALEAMWATTPMHARAPLALACCNRARAEEIARDLLSGKTQSSPHFAWQTLPALVRDEGLLPHLLHKRGDLPLKWTWFAEVGALALSFYEESLPKRTTSKQQRELMVEQLVNLRGPRVAALLAPLAGKAAFKKQVRAYFERHPDLLDLVMRDPRLTEHRDALAALADKKKRSAR